MVVTGTESCELSFSFPTRDLPVSTIFFKLLVIRTRDIQLLRGFYELLGLHFSEEQHGKGPIHFSASVGDAVFEIYPLPEHQDADDTTRLGFAVPEISEVLERIESEGGKIVTPASSTPWGTRSVVADPDGRKVELYEDQVV